MTMCNNRNVSGVESGHDGGGRVGHTQGGRKQGRGNQGGRGGCGGHGWGEYGTLYL